MDPIAVIRKKLTALPGVEPSDIPNGIRINPPNEGGFAVEIEGWGDQWRVSAGDVAVDSWFEDAEAVLDHVAFLLSDEAAVCEWSENGKLIGASVGPVGQHPSLPTGTFDDPPTAKTVRIFRNRLSPKPDFTP
jgi:hypothetical protein